MEIDITSPQGNTLVALATACSLLHATGYSKDYIAALRAAVMNAESAQAARDLITKATNGSITFFKPEED
jgi:hypothetical protein